MTQSLASNPRMLVVEGPDRVHSAFSRRLAERDVGRVGREFQILLVDAARGQTYIDPDLPQHARRAIEDVAEFLPFTSFRLIDSGWMKTSGRGQMELSGPDGTRFEAALIFDPEVRLEGVVLQISSLHVRAVRPAAGKGEESSAEGDEPRSRTLLNSSLTLELGETAVVGTSKLNGGDHALVVLLTAVE